jgi:hypothetical protein
MKKAPLTTLGCVLAVCALLYTRGGAADPHRLTSRGFEQLGRGDYGAATDDFTHAIEFPAYVDERAGLESRDLLNVASAIHQGGDTSEAVLGLGTRPGGWSSATTAACTARPTWARAGPRSTTGWG